MVKVVAALGATTGATAVNVASPPPIVYSAPFYSDLLVLNWANISYALAAILSAYAILSIVWRRIRPLLEDFGWVKVRRTGLTRAEKKELLRQLADEDMRFIKKLLVEDDTGHGDLR